MANEMLQILTKLITRWVGECVNPEFCLRNVTDLSIKFGWLMMFEFLVSVQRNNLLIHRFQRG